MSNSQISSKNFPVRWIFKHNYKPDLNLQFNRWKFRIRFYHDYLIGSKVSSQNYKSKTLKHSKPQARVFWQLCWRKKIITKIFWHTTRCEFRIESNFAYLLAKFVSQNFVFSNFVLKIFILAFSIEHFFALIRFFTGSRPRQSMYVKLQPRTIHLFILLIQRQTRTKNYYFTKN